MTKICVFGAGAIGGLIAAQLAHAGKSDVSVIVRGANLEAIRSKGLILRKGGDEFVTRPRAAEKAAELGPQDFVIIGLKAYALTGAIDALMPLLGPEAAVAAQVATLRSPRAASFEPAPDSGDFPTAGAANCSNATSAVARCASIACMLNPG